jgi:hypothetical protein
VSGGKGGAMPSGAYQQQAGGGGVGPVLQQGATGVRGLGALNPYYAQMNPDEQKAARTRAMLGALQGLGSGKGMQYGLGQLDAVVNESYQRAERSNTRAMTEREQTRREAEDKAQAERWERSEKAVAEREERMAKQFQESLKQQRETAKANQEAVERRLRIEEDQARAAEDARKRQLTKDQRLAELTRKMATGGLNQNEQIEYHSLGGSPYAIDFARRGAGTGSTWNMTQGGGEPSLDDKIRAAGSRPTAPAPTPPGLGGAPQATGGLAQGFVAPQQRPGVDMPFWMRQPGIMY